MPRVRSTTIRFARFLSYASLALLWLLVCESVQPGQALALQFSQTSLAFASTQSGANPPAQTLTFWKVGNKEKSWTVNSPVAWLSATPGAGTISTERDQIQVAVNAAGLTAGVHASSLMITTVGANGVIRKAAVPVTLTIAPAPAAIGITPTALTFSGTAGGANPPAQTVTVSNTGGGTLSWTVSDNAAWLTLSPVSGTNSGTINVSVNLSGLTGGTYNATMTVSATGATTKTLPVTLTVVSATTSPAIGLTPTSLAFSGTAGGANPSGKSVTITNPGGATLSWSTSDNAAWLSVAPTSGTTTTETDTLTASVNLSGLSAGTYSGMITVTAVGASNSPRTIPVSLTVSAPTTGMATLSWNANTEADLVGYKVYRATSSGAYGAPIATLGGTTTSYVASGLQPGTTYYFAITAYDSAGNESAFSNEVSKSIY